ncbi:MAG TPA: WbqC family protein [Bacteroidales bacterium]|nr:WbqC family protein [Bacteroidales bacterium]
MHTTLLSTAYLAPVQYYWHWRRSDLIFVEACEHYVKQTWRNRCMIGTANGPMVLSLPVEGNSDKTFIKDVRLSSHGNWQHLHWNGIKSAYNSSPFFEYYQDDLRPFFEKKPNFLFDFNEGIREKILELLNIETPSELTIAYAPEGKVPNDWIDLRNIIHPKKMTALVDPEFLPKPYYQVFDRKFGFQPNLSILDLLFNMGPEAILYL